MSLRLSDHVLYGEIINTHPRGTRGQIVVEGCEHPIILELLGDPGPDLQGRWFRFEAADCRERLDAGAPEISSRPPLDINDRQIGATGIMTASDQVRHFEGSVEEAYLRAKMGEPPPCTWRRRLYLEWFGNNGPVVIELVDPKVWFVEKRGDCPHGTEDVTSDFPPLGDPPFDANDPPNPEGPEIIEIRDSGERIDRTPADAQFDDSGDEDPDDPYGLFDPALDRHLEREYGDDAVDPEEAEDFDEFMRELALFDELLERGGGMELGEIVARGPDWRNLSEEEAEQYLKTIAARLALFNVAYHLCKHCSWREAYRILAEELAADTSIRIHPELRGTGWVTNYTTHDFCAQCEAEFEREYEEREARRRKENPDDDDDVPF